jgi:hypothetical protein
MCHEQATSNKFAVLWCVAVEEWRQEFKLPERLRLNNPTLVWRKWTTATRVKKPKPRTAGVSATEHGRAQAMIGELQARIAEQDEELSAARDSIKNDTAEGLRARLVELVLPLSHDDRMRHVSVFVDALGLNIRDWVTWVTLAKRAKRTKTAQTKKPKRDALSPKGTPEEAGSFNKQGVFIPATSGSQPSRGGHPGLSPTDHSC